MIIGRIWCICVSSVRWCGLRYCCLFIVWVYICINMVKRVFLLVFILKCKKKRIKIKIFYGFK